MITYIHRSKLEPHPDNPRQDLGDLTELAASIKKSGLLQNLTVVRSPAGPDKYRIIIGHRRFAASELAGLEELPCAIEEMSAAEQIATMLAENMQRNELTISDQVYGVQTMMNLGENIKAISDKTGLSESTVRRRAKLVGLNSEKLIAAEKRGATLLDFVKLADIQDPAQREALMDELGTANFNNRLAAVKDQEKIAAELEAARPRLEPWARLVSNREWIRDKRPFERERDIRLDDKNADFTPVELKEGEVEILCVFNPSSEYLVIYRITGEEAAQDEASARRAEEQRRRKARTDACNAVRDRMYTLREYFMKHDFTGAREHADAVLAFARDAIASMSYNAMSAEKRKLYEEIVPRAQASAALQAAAAVWSLLEGGYQKLDYASWDGRHKDNPQLDMVYAFLRAVGYEMSDEEKAWQSGSHPCFFDPEEAGA